MILFLVLGPLRTFTLVSVTFASTGAGVSVGGGTVGSATRVGIGVAGKVGGSVRVGVGFVPPSAPSAKFPPTRSKTAQKSSTTAPIASGIHSRFGPNIASGDERGGAPPGAAATGRGGGVACLSCGRTYGLSDSGEPLTPTDALALGGGTGRGGTGGVIGRAGVGVGGLGGGANGAGGGGALGAAIGAGTPTSGAATPRPGIGITADVS